MTATPGPPPGSGPPRGCDAAGPSATGAARRSALDRATAGLDGLAELPVEAHVERFDAVHTALTDLLSDIDGI